MKTNTQPAIIVIDCPLINVLPDSNGQVSIDKRLIQEMMFTLLCYVSQKEVEKISLRTKEALKAKRENGTILGRPKTINEEKFDRIKMLYAQGYTMQEIAYMCDVSVSSVCRCVNNRQKGE